MSTYTVVYALAKSDSCHHHVARVVEANLPAAIDRCRADALPGFEFVLIGVFDCDYKNAGTWLDPKVVTHDFSEEGKHAR